MISKVEPLRRKRSKLHDGVVEDMLALIRQGEFKRGERLPTEPELSERFDVSRGTLRAAIQELVRLGYVEVRQGDGTYLRSPDNDVLVQPFQALLASEPFLASELLQLRRLLEPEIARLAATKCTATDASILRDLLDEQHLRTAKGETLAAQDLAFHHEIARIADNNLIRKILTMLHSLLKDLRYQALLSDEAKTVRQHQKIAEAIIKRDPEKAKSEMAKHLESVENILKQRGITG
jgi:GntR family transcriptional regulator, transcriptional repressor for pyruvate dehydrogenase complex